MEENATLYAYGVPVSNQNNSAEDMLINVEGMQANNAKEGFEELNTNISTLNSNIDNLKNEYKLIEFDYAGVEYSAQLPKGFNVNNTAIVSAMYYNSSNSSWTLVDITNTNIRFNINNEFYYYNNSITSGRVRVMLCRTL